MGYFGVFAAFFAVAVVGVLGIRAVGTNAIVSTSRVEVTTVALPLGRGTQFTVQLTPENGSDTWISNSGTYVYGLNEPSDRMANEELRVGGNQSEFDALLRFPLERLPRVARHAEVRLYSVRTEWGTPGGMYLDIVVGAWEERIRGALGERTRVAWDVRPRTERWSDRVLEPPPAEGWYVVDITEIYNAWMGQRYLNHGIALAPASRLGNFNFFRSSASADTDHRPQLVVFSQP